MSTVSRIVEFASLMMTTYHRIH